MNKTVFNDYATAFTWIKEGRNGYDRPVANNTRLRLVAPSHDYIGLRLHATDVIRLFENGDVEFNSGNWRTVTTKDRMGYHGGFAIWSDRGQWYIQHIGQARQIEKRIRTRYGLPHTWQADGYMSEIERLGTMGSRSRSSGFFAELAEVLGHKDAYRIYRAFEKEIADKCRFLFFDGIRFDQRGRCINGLSVEKEQSKTAASERARLRIRDYARKATEYLDEGIVCSSLHEPYNEITEFDAHYLERVMDEGDYPIRLFFDAVESVGYSHPEIILGHRYDDDLGQTIIGGERGGQFPRKAAMSEQVANAIYRFVGKRLLPDRELRNPFNHYTLR